MSAEAGTEIREATDDEIADATSVLDAAMLAVDRERVRTLAGDDDGAVLVAIADGEATTGVVLGALVLDGREIAALAVRPRRRGGGIGSALVRAAAERTDGPLLASFDAARRPFYERLGFAVERGDGGRYRGRLDATPPDRP
jgi:GNAT superfamily N-acetyltransferase